MLRLDHVGELVGHQRAAGSAARVERARREEEVDAGGERTGAEGMRCLAGVVVGMDAHLTQVGAAQRLHLAAQRLR